MDERTWDRANHRQLSHVPGSWPLSAREAAIALGVSERTIRRAITEGVLPATKHAGVYRIKPGDLTHYWSQTQGLRLLPPSPVELPTNVVAGLAPATVSRTPQGSRTEHRTGNSSLTEIDGDVPEVSRLPAPLTLLVGRKSETLTITTLLDRNDVRLVTLTGPGGVGKTRLALDVATRIEREFVHGVCFVSLAPVRLPNLVLSVICQALGVPDDGIQSLDTRLRRHLRDQNVLLVLDSFEHVAAAACQIAEVLAACPRVKMLITSRSALHISGEHEVPVPPLEAPVPADNQSLSALAEIEAVALFLQRAEAVRPNFALTEHNAAAVVEICCRLDGLPLAIELAAARVKVLSPQELLTRLTKRLQVLSGGAHDLPIRLQAMTDAIAWSYDLLLPTEQALFRRLAVFVGSCTIEAAEAVAGDLTDRHVDRQRADSGDSSPSSSPIVSTFILDALASLVDKSLLQRIETDNGESRFGMLETIREFGLERLVEAGEEAEIRGQHARWCLRLASQTLPFPLRGAVRPYLLDQLEVEVGDMRAALTWLEQNRDAATLLDLTVALTQFWSLRSYRVEGRQWLERALAMAESSDIPPSLQAAAFHATAALTRTQDDHARAVQLAEEALSRFRALDDRWNIANVITLLGILERSRGNYDRAAPLHKEALDLFRNLNEPFWVALAHCNLGTLAYWQGDDQRAVAQLEESVVGFRSLNDPWGVGVALSALALVTGDCGDHDQAAAMHRESLTFLRQAGSKEVIVDALERIATLAVSIDRAAVAARLLGAAEALGEKLAYTFEWPEQVRYAQAADDARTMLGDEALASAWLTGRGLSLDQAIAEAMEIVSEPTLASTTPFGMTPREAEVLRLLASGRSDREIADKLFISHRTVHHHVASIYAKLGVHTRADAQRVALSVGIADDDAAPPG